jgi:hypothetical protein
VNANFLSKIPELKPLNPKAIDGFRRDRHFMDYIHKISHGNMNILWAGKPMIRHFLTLWSLRNLRFPLHPYFVITLLFLAGLFAIYGIIEGPRLMDRVFFFISLIFSIILSPLSLRKINHNTAYAVTENGIFFKFYRKNKTDFHYIDFNDIRSFRVDRENIYNPKLIIYPLVPMDFTTNDFITGEKNPFPTIEKQNEIEKLEEFLSRLRVNRRLRLINEKNKN